MLQGTGRGEEGAVNKKKLENEWGRWLLTASGPPQASDDPVHSCGVLN